VLVEEGRVINPLIEGLAVSTSVSQRLAILREQILGWDRITQLIRKLGLAREVKNQQEFENLVRKLRRSISVRLRGNSIISISYSGKNPAEAMNIVKTITDIFIAENLRQQTAETENAISFIDDQLLLYQKKLKQGEISAMEDDLEKLLVDSTEMHPRVIELRKHISASKNEMEEGNYEVDSSLLAESDTELGELKKELKTLKKEVIGSTLSGDKNPGNRVKLSTTTDDKLYKLLLLEKLDEATQRDAGVNQALYNELLKRLETAKITQRLEASRDGTRYTILDPARLPLKPIKPNRVMVLLFGLLCGLGGGVALVYAVEMFDHSFLGVDDARNALELPVFGGISKIVTETDIKAQKIHNVKIASFSFLVGIALLVFIVFNVILEII